VAATLDADVRNALGIHLAPADAAGPDRLILRHGA
jgi:hypothetical protein